MPRAYLIYGGPQADAPAPLDLVSVDPAHGTKEGGTEVTLRGAGFRGAPSVAFGAYLAPTVTVLSSSELRVVTPPSDTAGAVEVTVAIDGESVSLPDGFEYTDLPEVDLDDLAGRGFMLRESEGDASLGPSVAFGDLTGDGIDELIAAGSRADRFAVSIVRGGTDLPAGQVAFETSPRMCVITSLDPFLLYAGQVAAPGDVNGDGLGDLLVGAGDGLAYLVFGREDWPGELILEDEAFFFRAVRLVLDDRVSSRLRFSGTGDLTGDGLDDFAVGFVRSVAVVGEPEPQGEAELLFVDGRASWPEDFELDVPAFVRARLRRTLSTAGSAWNVIPAGDVNGDGFRDLLATRPSIAEAPGLVYLVYGSGDLPADADLDSFVEAGGGVRIELEETTGGKLYGRAAGDVNGDGFSDILISHEIAAGVENVTFLVAGTAELETSMRLSRNAGDREGVLRVFGDGSPAVYWNAVTADDFNADGYDDFLVGVVSIGEPPLLGISSSASLVLGSPGIPESPRSIDLRRLGGRGLTIATPAPGMLLLPAETSGDLNGDGHPDFALLHQTLDVGGAEPIRQDTVYVIYGLPGDDVTGDGSFVRGDSNSDG
ncbi:MAG: IPT/TIG domain-containing protein, partial [Actinobacteria bacterium]|nr:IPT/TIG domain-containing protein [Actinomycetota bacterium]